MHVVIPLHLQAEGRGEGQVFHLYGIDVHLLWDRPCEPRLASSSPVFNQKTQGVEGHVGIPTPSFSSLLYANLKPNSLLPRMTNIGEQLEDASFLLSMAYTLSQSTNTYPLQ